MKKKEKMNHFTSCVLLVYVYFLFSFLLFGCCLCFDLFGRVFALAVAIRCFCLLSFVYFFVCFFFTSPFLPLRGCICSCGRDRPRLRPQALFPNPSPWTATTARARLVPI